MVILDLDQVQARLAQFAEERAWGQFHNPKNLAMALAVEASEIMEHFQWLTPEQAEVDQLTQETTSAVIEELADVQIYLLRLADRLGVNLAEAVDAKIAKNHEKYPPELAYGSAIKHDKLVR